MQDISLANVSRRGFLAGVGAGAFVLAVGLPRLSRAEEKTFGVDAMPHGWRDDPGIFVAIAEDGTVTVTCHRSEMGQGVRTSIAMVVADELEADWSRVRADQAPGDETRFGNQDTDGSRNGACRYRKWRRQTMRSSTQLPAVRSTMARWRRRPPRCRFPIATGCG
jgi:isoquinoline 1-oxidoreductase beta subunit